MARSHGKPLLWERAMRATLNDGRANQPVTGPDIRSAQRARE